LQETGFVDVRLCRLGESGDARFLGIEDASRHRMSFCLECMKP
jgi:hypothetical protein